MMYACRAPASRRNSVFDSEQSPQKKPARWIRASSTTRASSRRSPRYGIFSPRPISRRAIGERVVEVAGDHQPLPGVALGHAGDDLGGGQARLGDRPQQPVLALGQLVGQLLDHVADGVELDHLDDVAMKSQHTVHVGHRPVGERRLERQFCQRDVLGRSCYLDAHARTLGHAGGSSAGKTSSKLCRATLKVAAVRDDVAVWEWAKLMTDEPVRTPGASTPGEIEARKAITRTTITPAPGTVVPPEAEPAQPAFPSQARHRPAR